MGSRCGTNDNSGDAQECSNRTEVGDQRSQTDVKPRSKRKSYLKRTGQLTQRDIDFLSSQTDLSADQVRHVYTEFYKSCKSDGRLTKEQFKELYKQLMGMEKSNGSIEHISEHIFRAFDHDRSGYIEFGEFLVGFAIASRGNLETRLSYAFDCYDADYSEYIEQDEIEPVLRAMMQMLGFMHVEDFRIENMVRDIMHFADVSNDGRISKNEFIQALSNDEFVRGMLNPFN